MPTPRNWSDPDDAADDDSPEGPLVDGADFAAATGRRLLFASPGRRRLLKGGTTGGSFGRPTATRATPYRGTSTGVPAWGAAGAIPART
eukprot:2829651-Prymnesium_polylepis.1